MLEPRLIAPSAPLAACMLPLCWFAVPAAGVTVVKWGGSAVTKKGEFETLNEPVLDAVAKAIAHSPHEIVVVHGAGSFGHFQAKEHGVSAGTTSAKFSWAGFCATRSSVTRLNAFVVQRLNVAGRSAVGLPSFPRWRTRGGRPCADGTRACVSDVRALLALGMTPVLHGDCVLDEERGAAVLGGDAVMAALCCSRALRVERAVFLTDVDGVFDRPPDQPGARLLPRITVSSSGAVLSYGDESSDIATCSSEHDVTGGIRAKIEEAAAIAARGVPVCIVRAGTAHAEAALRGETPAVCTRIERDESARAARGWMRRRRPRARRVAGTRENV